MKYRSILPAVGLAVAMPLGAVETDGGWEGELELGLLVTTGNTEETNLNGGFNLTRDWQTWRTQYEADALYSRSEDITTAERYRGAAQADYKLDERQFLFLRGSYEDDRFSGYDFQSSATTGYGNRVWEQNENSFLELSAGLGYRYDRLEEPDSDGNNADDEAIARLAARLDYELTPTSLFRQELGTEVGLEENNVVTISETSIQADFLTAFALKAAYRMKHNSDAPAGSESLDTETSFTLLYAF